MKKIILLAATVLISVAEAKAQSFVTSKQLDEYKNSLSYMSCAYAGKTNCYGAESLNTARATATKIKGMQANGLNASKKNSLDAMAGNLLMLISVDEAKAFINGLKDKPILDVLDKYVDGSVTTLVMTMPGEKTLSLAENGIYNAEGMNNDSVSQVFSKTKEEMVSLVKAQKEDEDSTSYGEVPSYLKGIQYKEEVEDETTYELLDNAKLLVYKNVTIENTNALGMETKNESILELRRFSEDNYGIKVVSSKITMTEQVKDGIYDANKRNIMHITADADLSKPTNETVDEKWSSRYSDMIKEDADKRRYDSNYIMLEYALDAIEKYDAKIEKAKTDRQKTYYNKKQSSYYTNAKIYYDNLAEFLKDEKVRDLRARYNALAGSM